MMEALWFSSALELIQLFSSPPFMDCLSLDQKTNDLMLFGATLYDGIWKSRNQVYFESPSPQRCDEITFQSREVVCKI